MFFFIEIIIIFCSKLIFIFSPYRNHAIYYFFFNNIFIFIF